MYSSHTTWLIVVGFILLLAMVGAITITLGGSTNREIPLINTRGYKIDYSSKYTRVSTENVKG
jgi:hypothetical protein